LRYPLSKTETLAIEKSTDGKLVSDVSIKQVATLLSFAQGEIRSSFWNAGTESGLTDNQIMRLAGIFGWDIDFAQEIREGDTFNVIFEKQYIDGEFIGFGDIVAAEFNNQGEVFQAVKYDDGNFYTPDGRSMRKSFLRAPVSFKYISSSFKKRRFHPVQKRWKAHRGVDYAGKVGTPVMAAGDGKVIKSAYDKYNGHHVFIQHGEKYTTKYLHFTKRAVKYGETVKQGQTIGYLGSTGLASGPHLHYEFLVNGVHRNPRTVTLPEANPIDREHAKEFSLIAQKRMKQLNNNKRIMLAMN
jgi:murein DD-endopeptidase MepM/ murein hydrolase activator NlpD